MSRFRLERLLEHRRRLSDAAQQELATTTRACRNAEGEQQKLAREEELLHEGIAQSLLQGPMNACDLQQMHALAVQSGRAVQRAVQVVHGMLQQEALAHQRAREAAQAHKSLENARDRFVEGARVDEQRRSVREADEIAGVRAARSLLAARARPEE